MRQEAGKLLRRRLRSVCIFSLQRGRRVYAVVKHAVSGHRSPGIIVPAALKKFGLVIGVLDPAVAIYYSNQNRRTHFAAAH